MNINAMKSYYQALAPLLSASRPVQLRPPSVQVMTNYYGGIADKIVKLKASLAKDNPNLNIWAVAGIGRDEVRHCSLLAWLLAPDESHCQHCQGDRFLRLFIDHINSQLEPKKRIKANDLWHTRVVTEYATGSDGRIDILIKGKAFTIAIEAKIDAGEQAGQLERYRDFLANEEQFVLIFLTLDGDKPTTGEVDLCMDWSAIATVCEQFIADHCQNNFLKQAIRQYSSMLKSL